MQQLWAPWRFELVEKPDDELPPGCVFCTLPRAKAAPGRRAERDRQTLVLGRTAHCFAMLNRWPYSNGHLLIIPRRHTAKLDDLSLDEWRDLTEMLRVASGILEESYRPHAMNLGMNLGKAAGAGIPDHLHWHIVPRWSGDTNFMPVLADVKVMIEHIEASWERLRPLFDARFHHGAPVTEWASES